MSKNAKKQAEERRHAAVFGKKPRVPSLRFHKASGQYYTVLSGKAVYFGKRGDPEVESRYHQAIAEWMAGGMQAEAEPDSITIGELVARFWVHAKSYYRTETDGRVKELEQFRLAFQPLVELYGKTPGVEFGPRSLKAVRQKMIDSGWCRPYTNKQVNRIRHLMKWAVSDELLPGHVLTSLQSLPGLRKGRSEAYEPEPVKPVAMELVNAVQPFVSRQVWAMIQLQLLTGARAGELTAMRPCDVDRTGEVWVYQLKQHKTAHHGFDRKIFIGPRGQKVLKPFLDRDPQTHCFSPAEALDEWRQAQHANRRTPVDQGNAPGTNVKDDPKWLPGERYRTDSYRIAIVRACDDAFPAPAPIGRMDGETLEHWRHRLTKEQKAQLAAWRKAHRWHPHQLRHNAATELKKGFGIDAARIILGHHSAAITEVYAERDEQEAVRAIRVVG